MRVFVGAAAPEVIVHQMTALADMRGIRKVDHVLTASNELRTRVPATCWRPRLVWRGPGRGGGQPDHAARRPGRGGRGG